MPSMSRSANREKFNQKEIVLVIITVIVIVGKRVKKGARLKK